MSGVIRFDSVSKKYRLRQEHPQSFRAAFFRTLGQNSQKSLTQPDQIWALKDVSFEIRSGEAIGLIGANGAGKSTTLKLISQVSQPSSGKVKVHGRIGALLELGAGFHPDLSGRDNIYLNGALLGMSQAEMRRKFDSIVAFSELEAFIDMAVKHYSSGMFARLAFAVNIHIDPNILLVDEVLAVGDQAFQQKCLDQIQTLKQQGTTICLVSHSADAIRTMCSRALWFEHGRLVEDGNTESVMHQYRQSYLVREAARLSQYNLELSGEAYQRWGDRQVEIVGVRLTDEAGHDKTVFETGQPFVLHLNYRAQHLTPSPIFGFAIFRHDGTQVCGPNTAFNNFTLPDLVDSGTVTYQVSYMPLLEGLYRVSVAVADCTYTKTYDYHDRLCFFRVINQTTSLKERYGLMTLNGQWQHRVGEENLSPVTSSPSGFATM